MAAPNMFDAIRKIHDAVRPNLRSHEGADKFTGEVAATLHFGSDLLGIKGDPNWGRRRNPSGILSDDVIQYRSTQENFDIIRGAGGDSPELVWQGSSGGPWVEPERDDVIGGVPNPDNPSEPGEPTPPSGATLDKILKAIDNSSQRVLDLQHRVDTLTSAVAQLHSGNGGGLADFIESKKSEINQFTDDRMHQCINEIKAVIDNHVSALRDLMNKNEGNDRCIFR